METLIATPTWVLFFGVTSLIMTLVNVGLTVLLTRTFGTQTIHELARRQADRMVAERVPCAVQMKEPDVGYGGCSEDGVCKCGSRPGGENVESGYCLWCGGAVACPP